jgi:proline dehydrogenase
MYAGAKAIFYALSRSAVLKRLASRHGLATPASFASRFIAGETIEAAIAASKKLQTQGLLVTLDHLGERVRTLEE